MNDFELCFDLELDDRQYTAVCFPNLVRKEAT